MEEVDAIIVHTLQSIGCDIEDDVRSLAQFTTELIVEAVARCLKTINNGLELPHKLPPSMSARFRVGTTLANGVAELGYRGDVGYQTFLYSSEADIRRVFMFLVEKLPKVSVESADETLGASALLQRTIAAEIARRIQLPWTPAYCKRHSICWRGKPPVWHREGAKDTLHFKSCSISSPTGTSDLTKPLPKEVKQYYTNDLPPVISQPRWHQDLGAAILESNASQLAAQHEWEAEWNQFGLSSRLSPEEYKERKRERVQKKISDQLKQAAKLVESQKSTTQDLQTLLGSIRDKAAANTAKTKGSRFTHAEELQFAQDEEKAAAQLGVAEGPRVDSEEELAKKREDELAALRDELQTTVSSIDALQTSIRKVTGSKQQAEEKATLMSTQNKEKQELCHVKKRTIDLLPEAENNIAKLQEVVDASAQHLVHLANQWEKHRAPLIDEYRQLKEVSQDRVSETQQKLEEITELRSKMKEVAAEAKTKEELHKQLVDEYERMAKNVNRSAYTSKIMEIVANIKKQKEEIDKILIETKSIQKEINQLMGKLDRTFTVTDELVFKDAKKDEAVRKAYKHLAALHENFNVVIKTVGNTGAILREIRELEDQIETESKKKILANLEKITSDYREMKSENTALMAQLRRAQSS